MATKPTMPEPEHGITAAWMQQALAAGGNSEFPAIKDILLEDIGAGVGLVGTILRCHLTYNDADANGPASVIVKLPSTHQETLQTARSLRLYQREYAFYRRLAPHVPMRAPALLYGDFDDESHRFVLLLEDLRHMTTADQIDGASATQAKTAIRAAARLHGRYWNQEDRPPLSGFRDSANPAPHSLVQAVYQASLAPALERFGQLFTDPMRQLAEELGSGMTEYMEAVAAGPMTFTHGDFRLDNMFFGDGETEDFAVVDWQISGIASGLSDVAYFLSSSVPVEVRREVEREALAEYHEIVGDAGVDDFTLEDCWRSYRQNMLGCFRTPIIAGGQLDFTSDRSRRLAEVFLQRTLTTIDDLDVRQFLPGSSRVL
jgi:aminoglycoside/choline kinase family phosphotransferase